MSSQKVEPDLEPVLQEIRDNSERLRSSDDLESLIQSLKNSNYVLLGEATHGTSEFYRYRYSITRKLVETQKISFIGVEGDWPTCYKINQYVKNRSDKTGHQVLSEVDRWPAWMWSNWEMLEFIEWLREYNKGRSEEEKVGFYGLDVYSLNKSIDKVVEYLEEVDPGAAEDARKAYKCFGPTKEGADYAEKIRMVPEDCRDEVVDILSKLRRKQFEYEEREGQNFFDAEQNALVAKNAESYYRALTEADSNSWNIRDRHMAETLYRLMDNEGAEARCIVWAHNSHVGDSDATDMPSRGQLNLGSLVRERHKEETSIVGFSTYRGEVIAADYWGDEAEEKEVPPAREGSYDYLLHRALGEDGIVYLEDADGLKAEKGHRAIGVVYHPENEDGNYIPTELADRYDYLIHVDSSSVLHPIKEGGEDEEPEMYPWGV